MNILFISPTYSGAGGIGPHAFRVAEKLREIGYNVELMHVPHIPIKNLKNLSFSLFGTIKGISNKKTYDVVHAWNLPSAFIMKRIKSKKKILSVHGVYSKQVEMLHSKITSGLVSSQENQILDWADILTTDSKSVQSEYKKKTGKDFEYLPAPLDKTKFAKIPNVERNPKQIAYVGRDSFEKGVDILRKIESQINGTVKFCTDLPWDETMKILKASQILVVPSRTESIPQVIKEAFYLKVPVIATNVGGIPELMKNNETGFLIEKSDHQTLIEKLELILNDSQKANSLGKAGRKFVSSNFDWKIIAKNFVSIANEYVN